MNLPNNPWGDYKRQNPANAANLSAAFFQLLFVVVSIGCAYYALKCKPFQTMSAHLSNQEYLAPAHPVSRHNKKDEQILQRVNKVAPLASMQQVLTNGVETKRKIAASRRVNGS